MMSFVLVTPGHRLTHEDCRRCGRKVRAGQVVLGIRLSKLPPGQRDIAIHKVCIDRMANSAPTEDYDWSDGPTADDAFDQLRQEIVTTGSVFPSLP